MPTKQKPHLLTVTVFSDVLKNTKHVVSYNTTVCQLSDMLGVRSLYNRHGRQLPAEMPLRGDLDVYLVVL